MYRATAVCPSLAYGLPFDEPCRTPATQLQGSVDARREILQRSGTRTAR